MNQDFDQTAADKALRRIKSLLSEGCTYRETCETLNQEGYTTISGRPWKVTNLKILIFRLRHKWNSFYALSQRRAGLTLEAA